MTTRHEAAVGALRAHNPFLPDLQAMDDTPSDEFECCSKVALAAADAVMLSDATVERAARALFHVDNPRATDIWGHQFDPAVDAIQQAWELIKEDYRTRARAVLAAAVGGDGE